MMTNLIYLHLPKCGGTTLTAMLDQAYDIDEISPHDFTGTIDLHLTPELVAPNLQEYDKFRFIRGHIPFDCLSEFRHNRVMLTMLRSPVERCISLYNYWRRVAVVTDDQHSAIILKWRDEILGLSMEDYLTSNLPNVKAALDNGMTRQLAGAPFVERDRELLLSQALANIETIEIVGLMERFSDSMRLISERTGIMAPKSIYHLNAADNGSAKFESLSNPLQQIILEMNDLDEIVYARAKEIFENRLNQIGSDHTVVYPESQTEANLTMRNAIHGGGWHAREAISATEFLRWTGPDVETTICLQLKHNIDYQFCLGVTDAMSPEILQGAHLKIGKLSFPFNVELDPTDGNLKRLVAFVPSRSIEKGRETEFRIVVPQTLSSHEIDPANRDKRKKGLAVRYLKVEAMPVKLQSLWERFWPSRKAG